MDTKTVTTLKALHEDALDQNLDPAQWAGILKTKVSENEWEVIKGVMSTGRLYIRNQEYRDMAVGVYAWMANDTITDEKTGKDIKITPWIEKIQAQGVTRPKDILHYEKIINLVDNPAAKELFGF